jgi:outer membrane protein OmpA-like peptidoglycan-associated protein
VPSKKEKEEKIREEEEVSEPIAARKPVSRPVTNLDSDGDGIPDIEDTCPDVMGLVQFGGCPPKISDPADSETMTASLETSLAFVDHSPQNVALERTSSSPEIRIEKEDAEFLDYAMNAVYFETNSDNLKSESLPVLDRISEILQKYPEASLRVEGHADVTGSDNDNLVLSIKRAFKVKYYLVHEKGVKLSRIESNGLGANRPIADNSTDEGRQRNRRVEFELLSTVQ